MILKHSLRSAEKKKSRKRKFAGGESGESPKPVMRKLGKEQEKQAFTATEKEFIASRKTKAKLPKEIEAVAFHGFASCVVSLDKITEYVEKFKPALGVHADDSFLLKSIENEILTVYKSLSQKEREILEVDFKKLLKRVYRMLNTGSLGKEKAETVSRKQWDSIVKYLTLAKRQHSVHEFDSDDNDRNNESDKG